MERAATVSSRITPNPPVRPRALRRGADGHLPLLEETLDQGNQCASGASDTAKTRERIHVDHQRPSLVHKEIDAIETQAEDSADLERHGPPVARHRLGANGKVVSGSIRLQRRATKRREYVSVDHPQFEVPPTPIHELLENDRLLAPPLG